MWKLLSENPDVAVTLITIAGGWLGLTKKKANTAALKDKLLARLRQAVIDMIGEYATVERARTMLHRAADELLADLKVKRTAALDALIVVPLIEQALKEYQERLGPIVMRMHLEQLFGAVSKLPAAFEATRPAQPVAESTVIVERDGSEVFSKPFEGK
jgi:hypothetical protein